MLTWQEPRCTSQGSGEAANVKLLKTMFDPKHVPEWAKIKKIKSIGKSLGGHLLGKEGRCPRCNSHGLHCLMNRGQRLSHG